MAIFETTVARVGEGEHQASEFTVDAVSVSLDADGSLTIKQDNGASHTLSATSWGAFKVVRVASAEDRL